MSGRFSIMRAGILEHLLAGKLSYPELGLYAVILLQVDFRSGIWWGSAPRLQAAAPRGISLRDVQRGLQNLNEIRFLRPFHEHGARGNYPVLIDKYDVKIGALKGKRLNAWKSESWQRPFYECCADADAESDADAAPYQEVRSKTKTKSADAGKPSSALPQEPKIETDDHLLAATFIPPTSKLEKHKAVAKSILLKAGYTEPLIELAFVRALDINEAKRKAPPRSVEWFVTVVKNTLDDPEEKAEVETVLANRMAAGIPASAGLELLEKPAVSRIAFVHTVVEDAVRRGIPARDVLAEKLAR